MSKRVAVIGAGWAGCAAAVELTRRGVNVSLMEASRTLGGRARRVDLNGTALDNGQHILLGAYRQTLRVMRQVGIDTDAALLRLPLQLRFPPGSGMNFIAPRLPAPFHVLVALLRATGLSGADKIALMRFSSAARWMGWQLDNDCTVAALLSRFDQTETLVELMWRPLCIAALNTPPERASAQIFLNVLKDSLGARRANSDMLLPRDDLSSLFPTKAAEAIVRQGGSVLTGTRIRQIARSSQGWALTTADGQDQQSVFDSVIVATDALSAASLLAPLMDVSELQSLAYEPITTCYLQYPPDCRLAQPFNALIDSVQHHQPGQFVFDRGQLFANQAGLLAVVISASTESIETSQAALVSAVAAQLASVFSRPQFATPLWSKVISEKRATFSCTPGLVRPRNATPLDGIVLAGDYTEGRYPATLEAAVSSGLAASGLLARSS